MSFTNDINLSRDVLAGLEPAFKTEQASSGKMGSRKITEFKKVSLLLQTNGLVSLAITIIAGIYRQKLLAFLGVSGLLLTFFSKRKIGQIVLSKAVLRSKIDAVCQSVQKKITKILIANNQIIEAQKAEIQLLKNNNKILFAQNQKKASPINELECKVEQEPDQNVSGSQNEESSHSDYDEGSDSVDSADENLKKALSKLQSDSSPSLEVITKEVKVESVDLTAIQNDS